MRLSGSRNGLPPASDKSPNERAGRKVASLAAYTFDSGDFGLRRDWTTRSGRSITSPTPTHSFSPAGSMGPSGPGDASRRFGSTALKTEGSAGGRAVAARRAPLGGEETVRYPHSGSASFDRLRKSHTSAAGAVAPTETEK